MNPALRPNGLITLINRNSTNIYSGMFPGVVARKFELHEAEIDLATLANRAGVAFVIDEICGFDLRLNQVFLKRRPPINFKWVSIDVGSGTFFNDSEVILKNKQLFMPIKPFQKSFEWIQGFDGESQDVNTKPFTIIGSGHAAFEIALALRKRWPGRSLYLQAYKERLNQKIRDILLSAKISLIAAEEYVEGPTLLCTGSKAPGWLQKIGLPVNQFGRVLTNETLQVIGYPNLFAAGDCAVIKGKERPPSGVWSVRAAKPLALNLERFSKGLDLLTWNPQRIALQLLGGYSSSSVPVAFAVWGQFFQGPSFWFWKWKEIIDRRFMSMFDGHKKMDADNTYESNFCRGCAAKISAITLKDALSEVDLGLLAQYPKDASLISSSQASGSLMQSVDGFPALISDPWLNARLASLHACSDIWATGASVSSAQAIITLPQIAPSLQKDLLAHSLAGIKSALEPQEAELIGGHTFESRNGSSEPVTLGIEISLCVNGYLPPGQSPLSKAGLQPCDQLLISRPLGSGIIFAGAMAGLTRPDHLEAALEHLEKSQHILVEDLQNKESDNQDIHACTDITGFGLLGHLGEMLSITNYQRRLMGKSQLRIKLHAQSIPIFDGVKSLINNGVASTFAPSNRNFFTLIKSSKNSIPLIDLDLNDFAQGRQMLNLYQELIIDPQTCGPLVVSCDSEVARKLINKGPWVSIGSISTIS